MMTSNREEKEETLVIVIGAAAAAIFFLLAVNTSGAVNDMEVVAGPDAPIVQYSSFLFHYADAAAATTTSVGENNNNNDVTFRLQGKHAENTVEEVLAAVGYDMTSFERFSNGTIVVTATRVFDYNNNNDNNNDNNNTPTTNNWWQEMRVNQKEQG